MCSARAQDAVKGTNVNRSQPYQGQVYAFEGQPGRREIPDRTSQEMSHCMVTSPCRLRRCHIAPFACFACTVWRSEGREGSCVITGDVSNTFAHFIFAKSSAALIAPGHKFWTRPPSSRIVAKWCVYRLQFSTDRGLKRAKPWH